MTMRYLLIAGLILAATGHAATATTVIQWSTPVNETGSPSDVVSAGMFFDSATAGQGVTLNGVVFHGQSSTSGPLSFFGSGISVGGARANYISAYSAPNFGSPAYNRLVGGAAVYDPPYGGDTITIAGLTVGNRYEVQIFQPFWNRNWATSFTAGNTSANVNATGNDVGAGASTVPQYVTGTFIATATSAAIDMSSPTTIVLFDAIQVRTLATVAEPPAILIALSAFAFMAARRRNAAG